MRHLIINAIKLGLQQFETKEKSLHMISQAMQKIVLKGKKQCGKK